VNCEKGLTSIEAFDDLVRDGMLDDMGIGKEVAGTDKGKGKVGGGEKARSSLGAGGGSAKGKGKGKMVVNGR